MSLGFIPTHTDLVAMSKHEVRYLTAKLETSLKTGNTEETAALTSRLNAARRRLAEVQATATDRLVWPE